MKPILWNLGKNIKLKVERGIGFEVVMAAVKSGNYRMKPRTASFFTQCSRSNK